MLDKEVVVVDGDAAGAAIGVAALERRRLEIRRIVVAALRSRLLFTLLYDLGRHLISCFLLPRRV